MKVVPFFHIPFSVLSTCYSVEESLGYTLFLFKKIIVTVKDEQCSYSLLNLSPLFISPVSLPCLLLTLNNSVFPV